MSDIRFNTWLHQSGTGGITQVDGGHVGIGTTNPDIAVHTANAKKVNVGIVTANSVYAGNFYGDGSNLTGTGHVDKIIEGDTKVEVFDAGSQYISAEVNGSEKLRIDSSGHIQVNTTTKGLATYGEDLTIASSDHGGITIRTGTGHKGTVYFSDGTSGDSEYKGSIQYDHSDDSLRLATGGSVRLFIDSSGDIGLGESNPNRSGYSSPVVSVGYNTGNGYGVLELLGNKTSDSAIANIVAYNIGGSSRVAAIAFERSGANNSGAIRFETYASGSSGERLRITSDGNVGMGGNTNPTNVLHIKTAATNTAVATIESTATDSYPFLRLKNDAREYQLTCHGGLSDAFTIYDGTSSAHRFTIDSSGKVGMNESSPDQALHIKGDNPFLELEGTSNSGDTGIFLNAKSNHWLLRSDNYGSQNLFTIKSGDTSSSTHRFAINSSGYVGINETSPVNLLTISNTATHTDDSIGNLQVRYTGSGATANSGITVKNYKGTSQFMQWESSGLRMGNRVVTNSGNGHVYITAGSDTVRLSINASTGNFTGSSSADISDGRLKENITSISNATAIIKQLLGKTFTWKEEAKLGTDKKYGFIAQEMKTVLPDLVYQDVGINRLSKDTDKQGYGQGEIVSDYSDDYKDDTKSEWSMAVQTSGVIPILVEAFKELEARIAALET